MTNNKKQTAVEWLYDRFLFAGYSIPSEWKEQAKAMEIAGKEMSYDDGYKEGYKRAYELMEWCMKNYIKTREKDI
jgi:hypothetical protein